MNIFQKLFGKSKKNKKNSKKQDECWYNNAHEKKRRRWNTPNDGGWYNGALFDMSQANNAARRK